MDRFEKPLRVARERNDWVDVRMVQFSFYYACCFPVSVKLTAFL